MSIINNQLFLSKIEEIVNKTSGALLLSIPGVSEILTEFFNNDALDELRDEDIVVMICEDKTIRFKGRTYKVELTPCGGTVLFVPLVDWKPGVELWITFGEFMDLNPQEIKGGGSSEQIYTDL